MKYIVLNTWCLLVGTIASFCIALLINIFLLTEPVVLNGNIQLNEIYFCRLFFILLGCILYVFTIAKMTPENKFDWGEWGDILYLPNKQNDNVFFLIELKKIIVWILILITILFVFIFLKEPELFTTLGSENKPIEIFSAIFLAITSSIFAYIALYNYKNINNTKTLNVAIALFFSFIFFLICMEEISWFQQILKYETPEIFYGNTQNELNFHNFYTYNTENLYYFSMFLLLVLIPFSVNRSTFTKFNKIFKIYIPSPFIIYVSSLIFSYNDYMWFNFMTQITFFLTLVILLYYLRISLICRNKAYLEITLVFIFTFSQILFLIFHNDIRLHYLIKEYKEFFITVACLIYSIDILNKLYKNTNI